MKAVLRLTSLLFVLFATLVTASSFCLAAAVDIAANDDNVEWNGVRHYYDMRDPEHPAAGEAFTVELRTFHYDITSAAVRIWNSSDTVEIPMNWDRNSGDLVFDFWHATIPAEYLTGVPWLYYSFVITDGADTDLLNRQGMHEDAGSQDGDFFVDLSPYANHPLGATVVDGGVVFRLWAPYATRVQVAGSWDGWLGRTDLVENSDHWTVFVPGAEAGDEYRFRLNDSDDWWKPDPRGRAMTNSAGNSIVVDPDAYPWGDYEYRTPYFEEMVIYEMHIGTFAGLNDGVDNWPARYRDVVDAHLDHLVDLGVNAIELLPITEFPGDIGWGYNPVAQFAIESAYGSPDDFRYLIDNCHRHGIAVLVDVKHNAAGISDNWMAFFDSAENATYYYPPDSPNRNGGGVIGDRYNYNRTEVRDYLIDSMVMFLREYRIDGFRMDHTNLVKDLPSGGGEGWQLLREMNDTISSIDPTAIIIAEQWPNDSYVTKPVFAGGAGCHSQWHETFKNSSLAEFGTMKNPGASPNLWSLWWAYTVPYLDTQTNAVNYVESHDESGCFDPQDNCWDQRIVARVSGDVNDGYAIGRSKLAGGTVLFTPGIPMLWMGQEWAEFMVWSTYENHRINWDRKQAMDGVFNFFAAANRVRRMYPALRSNAGSNIHHINDGADVMAIHRYADGEDVIVVFNFSTTTYTDYRIGFPWDGKYDEILNSDAELFDGGNNGNAGAVWAGWGDYDGLPASAAMTLPPMSVLVFSKNVRQWEGTPTPTPVDTQTPTPAATFTQTPTPGDGVSSYGLY